MKRFVSLFIITLIIFINVTYAISNKVKQKYPYPLITKDYDILSENDLGSFTWGLPQKQFIATEGTTGPYNYWQCFPRENVMVTLSDTGQSSDELGWKNNVAYLKIRVFTDKYMEKKTDIQHVYEMRTNLSITDYQKKFNKWLKLMKGEKYVCLAGHFVDLDKKVMNGRTWITYGWIFEKLKTKKGCDSYFDSCTPTYEKYLREKAKTI